FWICKVPKHPLCMEAAVGLSRGRLERLSLQKGQTSLSSNDAAANEATYKCPSPNPMIQNIVVHNYPPEKGVLLTKVLGPWHMLFLGCRTCGKDSKGMPSQRLRVHSHLPHGSRKLSL